MKTAAVICEYNPMHRGHIAMLSEVRKEIGGEGAILCLMSGDFVQRGEPAIFTKYERARRAVENGADLVLELPYPWSASVAEHFAAGAVSILNGLAVVTDLYFGSETPDTARLSLIARRLNDRAFLAFVKKERKNDRTGSFPRLLDRCYSDVYGEQLSLRPNEILACRYLSELAKTSSPVVPHALPLLDGASASEERKKILAAGDPGAACLETGARTILAMLSTGGGKDRFSGAASSCASLDELFAAARTPADTDARLKRELLTVLLGSTHGEEKAAPSFTVLLAADRKGTALLREIKKKGSLPVVTKQSAFFRGSGSKEQYALYQRAQRFYAAFAREPRAADLLMKTPPFIKS